jgi:CheY-like chemotaxis protein
MKILLVEDEYLVRAVAVEALQEAGFEVIEAGSGEEAIEQCTEHVADALLTDIRLPGKVDGWDLAEHCRISNPHIPVVYVTGYKEVDQRPVSGSRFLQKPYKLSEMIEALQDLLNDRRTQSRAPEAGG